MELIDMIDQYWSAAHLNSISLQGLIELAIISGILIFKLNIIDWKP
jgi:hypothetical protein